MTCFVGTVVLLLRGLVANDGSYGDGVRLRSSPVFRLLMPLLFSIGKIEVFTLSAAAVLLRLPCFCFGS